LLKAKKARGACHLRAFSCFRRHKKQAIAGLAQISIAPCTRSHGKRMIQGVPDPDETPRVSTQARPLDLPFSLI